MPHIPLPVAVDPLDVRARQCFVDAVVDDVGLRMLLDTGAPRSAVPRMAPFTSRLTGHVEGGGGVFEPVMEAEERGRVARLIVGDHSVGDLDVEVQPAGWPHPPLLGMDVFIEHLCCFRFSASILDIDLDHTHDHPGWRDLTSKPGRTPAVPVEVGGVTVTAIWDTGAGITLIDRDWALTHPGAVTMTDAVGHGTDSAGRSGPNDVGVLAPSTIGGVEFPAHDCGVVDLSALNRNRADPIVCFLGLPQISQADWCFDLTHQTWIVRTQTKAGLHDQPPRRVSSLSRGRSSAHTRAQGSTP